MFCPACGEKNNNNNNNCFNCGTPLIDNFYNSDSTSTLEQKTSNNIKVNSIKNANLSDKKTKQNNKNVVYIAVFCVVLLIISILFFVGKSVYNPKNIALKFFDAYSEHQYNKMYSYIFFDTEKNDFANNLISEDGFTTYMNKENKKNPFDYPKNRKIKETTNNFKNSLKKSYTINYISTSDYDGGSYVVNLVNTGKKKFLIFDEYKVVNDFVPIIRNVTLILPDGAIATVDGTELRVITVDSQTKQRSYNISNIIGKNHNVTISGSSVKELSKDYKFENDSKVKLSYSIGTEMSELSEKINATLKAIISGASIQKPFSELGVDEKFNNYYEEWKKIFISKKIKSAKVYNITINDSEKLDDLILDEQYITVKTEVTCEKEKTDIWSGKTYNSEGKLEARNKIGIYYDVESSSWKIDYIQ